VRRFRPLGGPLRSHPAPCASWPTGFGLHADTFSTPAECCLARRGLPARWGCYSAGCTRGKAIAAAPCQWGQAQAFAHSTLRGCSDPSAGFASQIASTPKPSHPLDGDTADAVVRVDPAAAGGLQRIVPQSGRLTIAAAAGVADLRGCCLTHGLNRSRDCQPIRPATVCRNLNPLSLRPIFAVAIRILAETAAFRQSWLLGVRPHGTDGEPSHQPPGIEPAGRGMGKMTTPAYRAAERHCAAS
jgi:hypothetical protein